MDYQKYSKAVLAGLPAKSPELMCLLTELQLDIREELYSVIKTKFREIAGRLNTVGHDLQETARPSRRPRDIDYCEGGERVDCDFYVCCDTVISAGYGGTSACEADLKNQLAWEKNWACVAGVLKEDGA
jgi:hypothetical protein